MIRVPLSRIPVGSVNTFTFMEPYDGYVKSLLNVNSDEFRLEVSSITNMRDHIKLNLRDPMTDVYSIVGLKEPDYKRDLEDNVPIITFVYYDEYDDERRFRVPLTYIEDVKEPTSVQYVNKGIFIGLDMLPLDLKLDYIFKDLEDMVAGRLGVDAKAKEVVSDSPVTISIEEHELRETTRKNSVTVKKSNEVLLREKRLELREIHDRLKDLGIRLGG